MKKLVSIILIAVLTFGALSSTSLAKADDVILDALKSTIIGHYDYHIQQARNILRQVEVTDAQAKEIVAYINQGKAKVTVDKGDSLDKYTAEERDLAMDLFDKVCKILGLTYTLTNSSNSKHKGDVIINVYKDGKLLGAIDGDVKTDVVAVTGTDSNALLIGGITLVLAAGAAFIFTKRKFSAAQE